MRIMLRPICIGRSIFICYASLSFKASAVDKKLIKQVAEYLKDFDIVIIFGSAARGKLTPNSDLDVAIAGRKRLTIDEKVSLINGLSKLVGREVDLVDLNQVSGAILKEALTKGKFIRSDDPELRALLM